MLFPSYFVKIVTVRIGFSHYHRGGSPFLSNLFYFIVTSPSNFLMCVPILDETDLNPARKKCFGIGIDELECPLRFNVCVPVVDTSNFTYQSAL